jgi:hypothetical protein
MPVILSLEPVQYLESPWAAQGIGAESPQEAHWRFRGLAAESPVFCGIAAKNAPKFRIEVKLQMRFGKDS